MPARVSVEGFVREVLRRHPPGFPSELQLHGCLWRIDAVHAAELGRQFSRARYERQERHFICTSLFEVRDYLLHYGEIVGKTEPLYGLADSRDPERNWLTGRRLRLNPEHHGQPVRPLSLTPEQALLFDDAIRFEESRSRLDLLAWDRLAERCRPGEKVTAGKCVHLRPFTPISRFEKSVSKALAK